MSDSGTDADLARDVGALIRTLEDLQTELDPGNRRRMRLPTPGELLRFTSEVTIPAAIIVLETNVRALRLLQRTIRMRTDAGTGGGTDGPAVRERAESLGRETLRGLDATLTELQAALEGRPEDDEAASLLSEAHRLQDQVDARLAGREARDDVDTDLGVGGTHPVDIDVEAELRSIRNDIDDGEDGGDRDSDGTDTDPGPDGPER